MEHMGDVARMRDSIKRKYDALRKGKTEEKRQLEKRMKPLTKPLKELLKLKKGKSDQLKGVKKEEILPKKEEPEVNEEDDRDDEWYSSHDEEEKDRTEVSEQELDVDTYSHTKFGPLTSPYFRGLIKTKSKGRKGYDNVYGIRAASDAEGEWMIGDKPVSFNEEDMLYIGGKAFGKVTPGLLELLFMNQPKNYSSLDLENYKSIVELTNAHRQFYAADRKVRASRAYKYKSVISKLFPPKKTQKKRGKGHFIPLERRRTYIYWDDPNELVERLFLLLASKEAGNTSHQREILSIEEELREGGYIL